MVDSCDSQLYIGDQKEDVMNQKIFAEKKLRCSESLFSYVLNGKRNLRYQLAKTASRLMGTKIDLWINPQETVVDRRTAWEKYLSTERKKELANG